LASQAGISEGNAMSLGRRKFLQLGVTAIVAVAVLMLFGQGAYICYAIAGFNQDKVYAELTALGATNARKESMNSVYANDPIGYEIPRANRGQVRGRQRVGPVPEPFAVAVPHGFETAAHMPLNIDIV
jgi:hypothetical protein